MKMELTDEKRKGYVVCALMILVSCLYLVYLWGTVSTVWGMLRTKMKPYLYHTGMVSVREIL